MFFYVNTGFFYNCSVRNLILIPSNPMGLYFSKKGQKETIKSSSIYMQINAYL